MRTKISLAQAMDMAPDQVAEDRHKVGADLFDRAVDHHTRRRLVADVGQGTTRDRDGRRSRYVDYDWADHYSECPDHIWPDFFRGEVLNSCSRMRRGLTP